MANEYAFDPTGTLPANRITDEQIIVLAPGDRKFHFTMPRWAPFFEDGLLVKLKDINNITTTLVMGVDYYLSHKYADASLATMHPVWGSITFLDRTIVGTVIVSYNTLGGVWTLEANEIATILLNTAINPRITTWENVTNRPIDFPVINHPWNLDDMVGQKELLEEIENFHNDWLTTIGINTGAAAILNDHINDFNNPHKVKAAQTGAYTKAEVNTLLTSYLLKTGTATNSTKFNNKTYQQIFTDVVNTKVNNAFHADNADNATNAIDSSKLNGKTLNQIMIDVYNSTVDNSNKFNGKTYQQLLNDVSVDVGSNITNALTLDGVSWTDIQNYIANATVANSNLVYGKTENDLKNSILAGNANTATNASKLEGKTLNEIINELQINLGSNALTFNNKTYSEMLVDVVNTKVNNTFQADNALSLNGLSWTDIQNYIANATVANSNLVYGYDYQQLVENIVVDSLLLGRYHELYPSAPEIGDGSGTGLNGYYYFSIGEFDTTLDEVSPGVFIVSDDDLQRPSVIDIAIYSNQSWALLNLVTHLEPNIKNKVVITNHLTYTGNKDSDEFDVGYKYINKTENGVTFSTIDICCRIKAGTDDLTGNKLIGIKKKFDSSFEIKTDEFKLYDGTHSYFNDITWITKYDESILNNLDNYYTKTEVDAKLQQLNDDLIAYINSL